jgi:hypothetical protein
MLSKLTVRVGAAVVTSLAVLALGLGVVAAPPAHAQQMPCKFGTLDPWPAHGTKVNVKINGIGHTLTCDNAKWQTGTLIKPPRPAPPGSPPIQPPRPR